MEHHVDFEMTLLKCKLSTRQTRTVISRGAPERGFLRVPVPAGTDDKPTDGTGTVF